MWLFVLSLFASQAASQSINGWGIAGGRGPQGGIGDLNNPVLTPQSFITDARILVPGTTTGARKLVNSTAPSLRLNGRSSVCNARRVVVDSSPWGARQEMLGFGFAITDSTVSTLNSLNADVLDRLLRELFGQEGINLGLMRHTIGSSDLTGENQYTYNDNGPSYNEGQPDLALSNFQLGRQGEAMADLIAKIGDYKGDITLISAPWSFPGWMKNNALLIAPNLLNGYQLLNNSFNPRYIPQAIKYFVKYVDAFKSRGVQVNGVSLMNEPLNYQGGYPCMYLDPVDASAIVASGLGEALHSRGIKVIAYDHNTNQPVYPYRMLQGAPDYVDAVAWHCYQSPNANYSVLSDFHAMAPDRMQLMTECTTNAPKPGDFSSWIAQHFLGPVRNGASGGTFWVLATDPNYGPNAPWGGCKGCQGALFVNSSTTYSLTHDYYMAGQFSKFVRRGAVNHWVQEGYQGDQSSTSNQFYVMSVKNPDGGWAVVFLNNLSSNQNVTLSFTDIPGQTWEGLIPRSAVTTWLIPSQRILEGNGALAAPPAYTQVDCAAPTSSTSASSASSTSSTSTFPPVPNTSHTINNYFLSTLGVRCEAPGPTGI